MKRTTYIMLGVLIAVPTLIILLFAIASLAGDSDGRYQEDHMINLSKEMTTMDATGVRAIKITGIKNSGYHMKGALTVTQDSTGKETFTYPKDLEKYADFERKADTLQMHLIVDKNNDEDAIQYLYTVIDNIRLQTTAQVSDVRCNVHDMQVILQGVQRDSLSVSTSGSLTLSDCNLQKITPLVGNSEELVLRNSKIHEAWFDLDRVNEITMKDSKIHIGHLTASSKRSIQKDWFDTVYWTPKGEKAELYVHVHEETTLFFDK